MIPKIIIFIATREQELNPNVFKYFAATKVPEEAELKSFHPSAPPLSNLSNKPDSLEGPPEAWSNPHMLKDARAIRVFRREQSAPSRGLPKGYNLLHKANSFGCPV